MRKIYDCFTFFNELDLLEIRLEEHYNYVDYFVIAEANKSHQGFDKEYFLENNWDRYKKYHDKIIHIKVDDMPDDKYTWTLENHQRDALRRGLESANPNDVIVISDCDEMLRPSTFELMRNDTTRKLWICRQPIFWSKINYAQIEPKNSGYNVNSMAVTFSKLSTPQDIRNQTQWAFHSLPMEHVNSEIRTIQHAGWHFSYLGDNRQAVSKLENFAHAEARHLIKGLNIDEAIGKGLNPIAPSDPGRYAAMILDDYFPKTIVENQEKWAHLIVQGGDKNIRDYLPQF
jgi:hypothetical protein